MSESLDVSAELYGQYGRYCPPSGQPAAWCPAIRKLVNRGFCWMLCTVCLECETVAANYH